MTDEIVLIADDQNRPAGSAPRSRMRRERLWHRATYVLVFNAMGQLYVERRTMTKDVFPGLLDPVAGGVVLEGESYEESARRELEEELGIAGVVLESHGEFRHESEGGRVWGAIFSCVWDGAVRLQPEEVAGLEMMSVDEVLRPAAATRFTPDGLEAVRLYQHRTTEITPWAE